MNVTRTNAGRVAILSPRGRFDFAVHRDFRDAAKAALADNAIAELQVDFQNVNYLDSAALGMLLLTLEDARAAGKTVSLSGAEGTVGQVLEIANFRKLFTFR